MSARGVGLLLASAVLLAWLALSPAPGAPASPAGRGGDSLQLSGATAVPAVPAGTAVIATAAHTPAPSVARYVGPGPDDRAGPGMLPHPITAEHVRIYRDVELIEGAWHALERKDFARARELLREHAAEYSGGYDDLQEGMSILTDCMERPGPEIRARAQRFYDEHTASTARRRIRRHCLESS